VTHVTDAKPVAETGGQPASCDVHGYVEPKVGFELKLPSDAFNGRYVQYGCQGLCGTTFAAVHATEPGSPAKLAPGACWRPQEDPRPAVFGEVWSADPGGPVGRRSALASCPVETIR